MCLLKVAHRAPCSPSLRLPGPSTAALLPPFSRGFTPTGKRRGDGGKATISTPRTLRQALMVINKREPRSPLWKKKKMPISLPAEHQGSGGPGSCLGGGGGGQGDLCDARKAFLPKSANLLWQGIAALAIRSWEVEPADTDHSGSVVHIPVDCSLQSSLKKRGEAQVGACLGRETGPKGSPQRRGLSGGAGHLRMLGSV